ncbi:MAG: hypothetical protein WAL95_21210 [Candidatus Acidiferrales bacterium]
MNTVVGVFATRSAAERACAELAPLGIAEHRVNILTPQMTEEELAAIPTIEAEQPGMGKALGAAVGGTVGLVGGMGIAEVALTSLVAPGIGPILAIGLLGGALVGAIGAATGGAIENYMAEGLPGDELLVYEDALRHGRSVVVVIPESEDQEKIIRSVFERAGAETLDRAREMWWLGLRDVEKEQYQAGGDNFQDDERYFRAGFEAALHSKNRGKSYQEARKELGDAEPRLHESGPFRRGYDRGRAYLQVAREAT